MASKASAGLRCGKAPSSSLTMGGEARPAGGPEKHRPAGGPLPRGPSGAWTWSRPLIRIVRAMRAGHSWRGLCIAPTCEGPRNTSNNSAHGPTSGPSTIYENGHLIRGLRDIGRIFSFYAPFVDGFCSLVALVLVRDLLLCAKDLFVAATLAGCAQHPRHGAGSPAAQRRLRPSSVLNSPESGPLGP
jgi:hypothetical protein